MTGGMYKGPKEGEKGLGEEKIDPKALEKTLFAVQAKVGSNRVYVVFGSSFMEIPLEGARVEGEPEKIEEEGRTTYMVKLYGKDGKTYYLAAEWRDEEKEGVVYLVNEKGERKTVQEFGLTVDGRPAIPRTPITVETEGQTVKIEEKACLGAVCTDVITIGKMITGAP